MAFSGSWGMDCHFLQWSGRVSVNNLPPRLMQAAVMRLSGPHTKDTGKKGGLGKTGFGREEGDERGS